MPQAVQKSKGTLLTLALLPVGVRIKPVSQTLTIEATVPGTAIAKAAVAIPLAAALPVDTLIPKGQWLLFKHPTTGIEKIAQLSEDAVATDEALEVYALPEAIPDGAIAIFPVKLQARTAAGVSRSANLQSVITFDSGSERDGTTTSRESNLSAPGNYLPFDAGVLTCEYAYRNDQEVWVIRTLPAPSAAYTKGKVTEGPAAITGIPDEVPADGFITENIDFAFLGAVTELAPTPTA